MKMRDPARIKSITGKLMKIWEQHPDLRFGQFYVDLVYLYVKWKELRIRPYDMMYIIEDDDFEEFLDSFKGFV
jgi:hypothetical protein